MAGLVDKGMCEGAWGLSAGLYYVPQNYAPHPAPEQPLPYSHRTHLELGLTCDTCHTGGQTTAQMGFPEARTCMSCHAAVAADSSAIQQLASYAASGETIPWTRVYEILPGVTTLLEPGFFGLIGKQWRFTAVDTLQSVFNLTDEENQLLGNVLYDLKMRYVKLSG